MSKKTDWYLENDDRSMHAWVLSHMTMGAVYAAVAFFGVIGFILVLRLIARILPEDPYAFLDAAGQAARALV
ncbi:hypothetical protein E2L08_05200 [Palleronia sediminis]|uniref:Intrinsic membrane protein PufX n=1 Tax=Palleronia sediminis TaxID=2547833 RepID=A0A4R6AE70_9RHOB|nr:RC-LH1 core complex protein PufX [Palleronia sediminis]TDL81517.1 hypothetical protein E2L08_05200 [Palleronia sediminis]